MTEFIQLLLLILMANGAPILMRFVFSHRFKAPIDFGLTLVDGQRLFGDSKTWPGLVAALLSTALLAQLLKQDFPLGLMVALFAMLGDLVSSFIKRRLGIAKSDMAPLLDQIPESLLPALMLKSAFGLDLLAVVVLVVCFILLEWVLSRILYEWGVRRRPY